MRVLVVYDITDGRLRRRLARLLGGYGERVQRSAFECELHARERDELERRLRALLPTAPPSPDDPSLPDCSVRVYVIVADPTELGAGRAPVRDTPLLVV